ncbi:hypothetical protein LINPERPRIM_LOCUS40501 [Linum perenne]
MASRDQHLPSVRR